MNGEEARGMNDAFDELVATFKEKHPLWQLFLALAIDGARKNGPKHQYRRGTPPRMGRTQRKTLAQMHAQGVLKHE